MRVAISFMKLPSACAWGCTSRTDLRFVSESQHAGQSFVDGFRSRKRLLNFVLHHHDTTSLHEMLKVLAANTLAQLVALQFRNIQISHFC